MRILKIWPKIKKAECRNLLFILLVCVFVLLNNSCSPVTGGENSNSTVETLPERPVLMLVFCDVTTSVGTVEIDKVINKAKDLFEGLGAGSRIAAYPIDDNDYAESLIDYSIPKCEKNTNLSEEMANIQLKTCQDDLKNRIDGKKSEFIQKIKLKSEEILKDKDANHRSCIIDTLGKVNKFFSDADRDKYRFEVVYLSDMIEQCSSKLGSIYMCSSKQAPNKATIIKLINENYKPEFNLKNLVGSNINVIITTNMLGNDNYKCLYKADYEDVWKTVFSKVGFSAEDFSKFNFDTDLPARLKKKD